MNELCLEILRHIANYKLTTSDVVARLLRVPLDLVEDSFARLSRDKLVGIGNLDGVNEYYYLKHKAAQLLHVERIQPGPFKSTPKASLFGTLCFCCLGDRYCPRIPDEVFKREFPELFWPNATLNYYTDGTKLGMVRVDTKENTKGVPYRTIQIVQREIRARTRAGRKGRRRETIEHFRQLVESQNFQFTIVTAFESRAKRLEEEMAMMAERHRLFHLHEKFQRDGSSSENPETAKAAAAAYKHWHKSKKPGVREPQLPPPMQVVVTPGLRSVLFPTALPG